MPSDQEALPPVPRWVWIFPAVILSLVAIIVWGAKTYYRAHYHTYTYRYRMTVHVDVGGQVRSGSSVIEVKLEQTPKLSPEALSLIPRISGEAVFVDLGDGRNIVALLTSGPTGTGVGYPEAVVPRHFGLSGEDRDLPKYPQLIGSWTLGLEEMPTLVTFRDVHDPRSAQHLQPNRFDASLGHDVRLRDITIEMTSDVPQPHIGNVLPWWSDSNRPAAVALRAAGLLTGSAIDAELAFTRKYPS